MMWKIERIVARSAPVVASLAVALAGCVGMVQGHDDAASERGDGGVRDGVVGTDSRPGDTISPPADVVSPNDTMTPPTDVPSMPADVPPPEDTPTPPPMDVYSPPPMDCAGSASGTSGIWTCTSDRSARQRCVTGAVQTESCPNGCVPQPLGTDDYCASSSMTGCSGSASGTSSIWTCTADHTARQRCVSGSTQTEMCPNGCVAQPTGTDDYCATTPPMPGNVSCAYPQWWNFAYSWSPGYYAITYTPYRWDNDLSARVGTPIQLRHPSQLVREAVHAWGWEPEFLDMTTGHHFAFLHLQPTHRLTTTVGMVYPAGTLVGYSDGASTETGYCVPIPGCGTANCSTGTCVYSTGAHLCVQTDSMYRDAFPMGMDACM